MIGACLMFVLTGRQLEKSQVDLTHRDQQIDEQNSEILRLKDRVQSPAKQPLVDRIRVDVIDSPSNVVDLQAQEFVKEQLSWIVNKPLDIFIENPQIPTTQVDGRTFSVDQKQYTIRVLSVTIGETLYLRVAATDTTAAITP